MNRNRKPHGGFVFEARHSAGRSLCLSRFDPARHPLSGTRHSPGRGRQDITPNRIIAKVSRVEVASKFFAPAPERFCASCVENGELTPEQAELATQVPMAQDLTAEADSGGHTDNRPAITLLPTMLALRDRYQARYPGIMPLRVGAAGGIATPGSAAAAFAMGAAYILTGSVNQACIESGSSDLVRQMLAEAGQADVAMAPASDMFEMGVKVQVLKRGTMFPMRATKLFELYRAYSSLQSIPPKRNGLHWKRTIFRGACGRDLATDERVLSGARSRTKSQGRSGSETQDGAGVSLVSRSVFALGQSRRAEPKTRLPGLVRAGDGCV